MKFVQKKIRVFLFLGCSFISLYTSAHSKNKRTYGNATASKVNSVYDGDTFRVDIPNFPDIAGKNIPIRINGIDTPEMRSKDPLVKQKAIEAKEYLKACLEKAKTIVLKNMKRGKYFRIVAHVLVDGKNIGDELIKEGLALPYDGGKKTDWSAVLHGDQN